MTRTDLARRLATAAIGIPLLALGLFWGPPVVMVLVGAATAAVGLHEFFALLAARGIAPLRITGFLVAAAFFVQPVRPALIPPVIVPLAALLVLSVMMTRAGDVSGSVTSAAGTLLGAVYLGALGGTIAALCTLEPASLAAWRVVLLLAVIMVSDTFAFFVGSAWGRHRLLPSVSPGKSVEGAFGGLVGGVVGALCVRAIGLPGLPLEHAVGLGAGVAALGIVGDLDESLLKRWAGVKDSGTLFPGHGGMLDRLDSLLFGAPVLYYYLIYAR